MPHIIVQHTQEVAEMDNGFMLGTLRMKLRRAAPVFLSVPRRKLLQHHFSVMFLQAGPWDILTNEIQVIILAHADEARDEARVDRADERAEAIAGAVEDAIRFAIRPEKPTAVTFSVTLYLGEVGYFESSEKLGDARVDEES